MKDVSHQKLQKAITLAKQKIRVCPENREEIILETIESLGFFPGEPLFNLIKEEFYKAI